MMKNYSIRKLAIDPDNNEHFGIFEHNTDQIIMTVADQFKAQIIKTNLNNGYGFDGWTPAFMLQKYFSKAK